MASHSSEGLCFAASLLCARPHPPSFGGQRRAPFRRGCGHMTPQLSSIIFQPQGAAGKIGKRGRSIQPSCSPARGAVLGGAWRGASCRPPALAHSGEGGVSEGFRWPRAPPE